MDMMDAQLLSVAVVTVLAVMSPGPDFAVVLRNSLTAGRQAGLATAWGIASGVSVHIAYTLLGFSYLVQQSVWVLEVMRYLGAAYLVWLGLSQVIKAKAEMPRFEGQGNGNARLAFRHGFLCNALNPKTALFFVALFTQVVAPETSLQAQFAMGLFIALAHGLWFSLVALMLTHRRFQTLMGRFKLWLERVVGLCLLGLGVKIGLSA